MSEKVSVSTHFQEQPSDEILDLVDLEEYGKSNRTPPKAKRYRFRIDKQHYVVEVPSMTGLELLVLAGKTPPDRWTISQKLHGGQAKEIGPNDVADFTTPGIERFMTIPLEQNEG